MLTDEQRALIEKMLSNESHEDLLPDQVAVIRAALDELAQVKEQWRNLAQSHDNYATLYHDAAHRAVNAEAERDALAGKLAVAVEALRDVASPAAGGNFHLGVIRRRELAREALARIESAEKEGT